MNDMFDHNDLTDIGYYFCDSEEERAYLESINDSFAYRVGEEFLNHIADKTINNDMIVIDRDTIEDFIKYNDSELELIINKVRREIIAEMKERRRRILVENVIGNTHRDINS